MDVPKRAYLCALLPLLLVSTGCEERYVVEGWVIKGSGPESTCREVDVLPERYKNSQKLIEGARIALCPVDSRIAFLALTVQHREWPFGLMVSSLMPPEKKLVLHVDAEGYRTLRKAISFSDRPESKYFVVELAPAAKEKGNTGKTDTSSDRSAPK
jgi:hypothetical protein